MSNFPHSSTIATSLSTSPFAVQSNLEALINRSRTHPLPQRRGSEPEPEPVDTALETDDLEHHPPHTPRERLSSTASAHRDSERRASHGHHAAHHAAGSGPTPAARRTSELRGGDHRIGIIREASYDAGAIFLHDDDDDERSALLDRKGGRRSRRTSALSQRSRKSYGAAASEPLGRMTKREPSPEDAGTSRSRSKARTPPRDHPMRKPGEEGDSLIDLRDEGDGAAQDGRGRATHERPLSRSMSPVTTKSASVYSYNQRRRQSVSTRFADDSSGDEGGDVTRGLIATGGGAMFGVPAGLGMTPASPAGAELGAMEDDPAEMLGPEELELPTNEEGLEVRQWPEALRNETALILRSAVPVFFTQIAEWSLVLASVVSIGHLGTTELAASSLASMTASVSSFSILQGLATSLDTLLPAAWTSSDPTRVGLWAQRAAVVMAGSTIPMFMLWWNVEGILRRLGQEADVAALASVYLRWLSVGIPGYGGNVIVKKYLQAQGLMKVPTYVLFIIAPLNVVMNYLLVWGPDPIRMGFRGGALATAISYNLTFLLSLTWVLFFGPREAFHPLHAKHIFSKLGTVTSLGLAGTMMISAEWWAWEACALAASLLGPTVLAAQSVLLSTASTFFQVPASLGIAGAVRCGNLLGAGRGWEAKWAARASMFMSIVIGCVNRYAPHSLSADRSAICIAFRKNWGYLFNNDPEVVQIVSSVMVWIGLFQVTDGVGAMAGSILRALGRHTTGAFINLTSYYIVGLPFGFLLAFNEQYHMGLVGIWIGFSVALGYTSIVSFWLVWRADWTRAVERVRERLGLYTPGEVGADGKWQDEGEVPDSGSEEPYRD